MQSFMIKNDAHMCIRLSKMAPTALATALYHINWTCQCKYALFTRFRIKGVTGTLWR